MAFTDNSDLYGSVNEAGVNRVVRHIMRKRPSLFNYATAAVASNRALWCVPVDFDSSINDSFFANKKNGGRPNPIFTIEDPLPVLGARSSYGVQVGLNFCVQLVKAELDLHPGRLFELPPELEPPLKEQRFAIRASVCGGLGCPEKDFLDAVRPDQTNTTSLAAQRNPVVVLPSRKLNCFCLDLFVVGHVEVVLSGSEQRLLAKVDALEIVDVKPEGLESNIECYLELLLQLVILPRVNTAAKELVLDLLTTLNNLPGTIVPLIMPKPPAIPHNPAIEDDQLKLFVDLQVMP
ncbi:MAG: hypothetical protein IGS54_23390 [Elainella sp. C42_A2020_010]|nr:hypothetical protein [Elainella sp. C42_A2020_010]